MRKFTFLAVLLLAALVVSSSGVMSASKIIFSSGSVVYTLESRLLRFHSGRGIVGMIDGTYSRDNILYCRMQLFAEINNAATDPEDVLVPNGLGHGDPGGQKNDAWSEGGIDYANLKRNLAYAFDQGLIPIMALWITNIDPLENRKYTKPEVAPNLPMANEAGYRLFLESLNSWIVENYPVDGYVIWEPCWEFNLYPWTNWGGAGGNRGWRLIPEDYYNAMATIRKVLNDISDNRIVLAAHIVSWSADEWAKRGKLRINGTQGGSHGTQFYLEGMKLCDVWGISLYGAWDLNADYLTEERKTHDVKYLGVSGYVDWLFDKIVKQCREDPDIGDKFIGTFEYNMPEEIRDLRDDILTDYTREQLDEMAIDYIYYTYSLIPRYFSYIKMLGWWTLFGSEAQWNAWRYCSEQYDSWKP